MPFFIGRGAPLYDFARFRSLSSSTTAGYRIQPLHRVAGGSASRSRASDILDGDVSRLVFLPGPNFDFDMAAESGQKAHQPFEGDFGEFSSQDFRQLGLSGSNPPRGGALGQAERRDCLVQPKDKLSLPAWSSVSDASRPLEPSSKYVILHIF